MTQQINLADPRLLPKGVTLGARHALWSVLTVFALGASASGALHLLAARAGALGLLAAAAITGESFDVHWTPRGLLAFAWLALMSACLGYSAYVWLATHTTPVVVGSYGYVNPAVAALVGWLVLGEKLGWMQIAGMLVILLGVALATGYLTPIPRSFPQASAT